MRKLVLWLLALVNAGVLVLGCNDGESGAATVCSDSGIDPDCTPAYEPTYDALYTNTFQPSCAKSGVSCHGHPGKQGGIDFDDAEAAYAALRARFLRPGEPECSKLVHVIVSSDGMIRMPPGANLPAGEQCAIIRWITAGAPR